MKKNSCACCGRDLGSVMFKYCGWCYRLFDLEKRFEAHIEDLNAHKL